VVLVSVKDSFRVVFVRESKNGSQCFDVIDGRISSRVYNLEKYLQSVWGVVDIDGGRLRGFSFGGEWDREHISEHRGCEG
jgi:hypothetical protein